MIAEAGYDYRAVDVEDFPYILGSIQLYGSGTLVLKGTDQPDQTVRFAGSSMAAVITNVENLVSIDIPNDTMALLRAAVKSTDEYEPVDVDAWAEQLAEDMKDAND